MNAPLKHQNPTNILVIHDGRKGHLNPSLAIAEILSEQSILETIQFHLPNRISKKTISLLKKLSHFPFIFQTIGQIFFKIIPREIHDTQLIICSGMPNLIYAAFLAKKFNIPLVYSGGSRKFNTTLIDWIVSSGTEKNIPNQIIIPVGATLAKFSAIRNIVPLAEASLLLGGPTAEYPFEIQHFKTMIQNFSQFCTVHQLQGNIVVSRRTPIFSQTLLNWIYNQSLRIITPEQDITVCEILQRSQYAFVSADSDTMLSEALHSGRTVITVGLDYLSKSFFDPLIQLQYLQRKTIEDLHTAVEQPSPLQREMTATPILDTLKPLLKTQMQSKMYRTESLEHFA